MKVKKALLRRAWDNGAINKITKRVAAAQVLAWELDGLVLEMEDIMQENGLLLGEIKQKYKAVILDANRLFTEVSSMLGDNDNRMNMYLDIDDFDKGFRSWAGLDKNINIKNKEEKQ